MAKKNATFPRNNQRNCLIANTSKVLSSKGFISDCMAGMGRLHKMCAEYSAPPVENQELLFLCLKRCFILNA
jgi:hypothetical protein